MENVSNIIIIKQCTNYTCSYKHEQCGWLIYLTLSHYVLSVAYVSYSTCVEATLFVSTCMLSIMSNCLFTCTCMCVLICQSHGLYNRDTLKYGHFYNQDTFLESNLLHPSLIRTLWTVLVVSRIERFH